MYKLKINITLENAPEEKGQSFKKTVSNDAERVSSELTKVYESALPVGQEKKQWTSLMRHIENAMIDE